MSFSEETFRKRAEERQKERRPRPVREMYVREAVLAERLVGTEEWNHYQEHLQGDIRALEAERASLREQILSPLTVEPTELHRLKILYAGADGAIQALQRALDLPKGIVGRGRESA